VTGQSSVPTVDEDTQDETVDSQYLTYLLTLFTLCLCSLFADILLYWTEIRFVWFRCFIFLFFLLFFSVLVLRSHVVCWSVCPSVTLMDQDHIGWKSWKLIARTINPTPLLFIAERPSTYSQGNMGNLGGDPTDHAWKYLLGYGRQNFRREKIIPKLILSSLFIYGTSRGHLCDSIAFLFYLRWRTPEYIWNNCCWLDASRATLEIQGLQAELVNQKVKVRDGIWKKSLLFSWHNFHKFSDYFWHELSW